MTAVTMGEALAMLGYAWQPGDQALADFSLGLAEGEIQSGCNIGDLPEALKDVAVVRACGLFLRAKKGGGQLDGFSMDLGAGVKQLQAGDTQVTFAVGSGSSTPEQRLDSLIGQLCAYGGARLAAFRRLAW